MFTTFLPQRSVISLQGEDAADFLQGLISNDIKHLKKKDAIYAAMLTPQGKFLHDFFISEWNGKIFLDVYEERAADLLSRLKIYRLRSKIEIKQESDICVAAMWKQSGNITDGIVKTWLNDEQKNYKLYLDPRLPEMGLRVIGKKNTISYFLKNNDIDEKTPDDYEYFRLSMAVPDTRDMIADKSFLMECGFERLHGIDFNKGCYVGQEVTARSKFRGEVRKVFYKVIATSKLPELGSEIISGEKIIGNLRTSMKNLGIAIVRKKDYQNAATAKEDFSCKDIKIDLVPIE